MPRTQEDVESYLLALGRTYESSGGTLVVHAGGPHPTAVAIRVQPPIVEVQLAVGTPPRDEALQLGLYRRLLELNATDLVHAAYALENGEIVLTASLELENLDMNELEAVLADIDVAHLRHIASLSELAGRSGPGSARGGPGSTRSGPGSTPTT
jgi:hypothetical protein